MKNSKEISPEEATIELARTILDGTADAQYDNHGQMIIYTGVFEWEDGSLHYELENDED